MSKTPVFLFTFANDAQGALRLADEWRRLEQVLQQHDDDGRIKFNLTPSVNKSDLWDKFDCFHNQIAVFHYGGHSDADGLWLIDEQLNGQSLATLLGQEAELKLVFLNGCSNVAQVQTLLDRGVQAVIATEAPIYDQRAVQLAHRFYQALSSNRSIREAFALAAAFVNNAEDELLVEYRSPWIDEAEEEFPWGLYVRDEQALHWQIPGESSAPAISAVERQGVQRQLELMLAKINRTREALALEDDPGRQVRYETQLVRWENEVQALREKWQL